MKIVFEYVCPFCPGDGVVRGRRAGVDWPSPCSCGARRSLTQYQLGRMIGESPKTIARLHDVRTTAIVSARLLGKLHDFMRHNHTKVRQEARNR